MTVQGEIQDRGISEVLHFTTNRGLVGILHTGTLLSRRRLPKEQYLSYILYTNAATRPEAEPNFDKSKDWLDYVNLSVSEINRRFFEVSSKWHLANDVWWVILSFDPVIMTHDGVWFATTNNKYSLCERRQGVQGLRALFAQTVRRLGNWRAQRLARSAELTTCEQAEILYPEAVPVAYLRRIYVRTDDEFATVRGWLRECEMADVEVIHSPSKFLGRPN